MSDPIPIRPNKTFRVKTSLLLPHLVALVFHESCAPADEAAFRAAGLIFPEEDVQRVLAHARGFADRRTWVLAGKGPLGAAGRTPKPAPARCGRCRICAQPIPEGSPVVAVPLAG